MVRGGADASSRLTGDAGAASTSDADTLAYTGADPLLPALVGLLAIIAGLLLLHVARRRRSALQ
jgi:LPXTG-motif cell wall-anchored protein